RKPSAAIEARDDVEIGGHELRHVRRQPLLRKARRRDAPDTVAPFPGATRLGSGKVVATAARMGVDDAERRRLAAQVQENAGEHRMLDDVGEIAGVKSMAIVHDGVEWSIGRRNIEHDPEKSLPRT